MRRLFGILRDIFEIYIPAIAFLAMFFVFLLQVFSRYIINLPLAWTQDLILVCFVWTVIFGACFAMRARKHIKFTLIYAKLKPRPAALSRLIGNLIIAIFLLILIPPSLKYAFRRIDSIYIFLPFVYLLCTVIGYSIVEMLEDYKILRGTLADSIDHQREEYL